jgi:diguanylate cyclase (GGDEF)-like protein
VVRAEGLRSAIEAMQPAGFPVTTSIGVASIHGEWDFEALFKAADQAMYIAKDKGRNQVAYIEGPGSVSGRS